MVETVARLLLGPSFKVSVTLPVELVHVKVKGWPWVMVMSLLVKAIAQA